VLIIKDLRTQSNRSKERDGHEDFKESEVRSDAAGQQVNYSIAVLIVKWLSVSRLDAAGWRRGSPNAGSRKRKSTAFRKIRDFGQGKLRVRPSHGQGAARVPRCKSERDSG